MTPFTTDAEFYDPSNLRLVCRAHNIARGLLAARDGPSCAPERTIYGRRFATVTRLHAADDLLPEDTMTTVDPTDHAQHVELLAARRHRFGEALTALLRIAKAENHRVIGPEHLDDLDSQLDRLVGEIEALAEGPAE